MRLTRRHVCRAGALAGGAALARLAFGGAARAFALAPAGATPAPAATAARVSSAETIALLRELILQRASNSDDPWVQAHVVLALGAEAKADGKPVVDALVAETLRTEAVDLKKYPYFPTDVERHPFHFLQILQVTDVPYDRVFVTPVGRFTRRDILSGSEALLDPKQITDELSWLVSVLTHEFPQDRDTFKTARGLEIRVSDIVQRHLRETDAAYSETFAAMAGATPYARGAIQRSACNGTHMLYGLIDALKNGYTTGDLRPHTERLTRALLFRMRAEPQLIDLSLRGSDAMVRLNADAAKLTFLGHAVEDLGYAVQYDVLKLDAAQTQTVTQAREQLAAIVSRLVGEYDLDGLQAQEPRAYKLILGDACHAYRGLRFWS
jgi:hypothetical protein